MVWQPQHKPTGKVCSRCGLLSSHHRVDVRPPRKAYHRAYQASYSRASAISRIVGIDGEGVGRKEHRYCYLAAADECSKVWTLQPSRSNERLRSSECLDFILGLPERTLVVGYAFLYDLTKILEDLPNRLIYLLLHEEKRAFIRDGRVLYRPVLWERGKAHEPFKLNFMNRRFTVRKGKQGRTVWDIFRFFQGKFTTALIDWKIAEESRLKWMAEMKEKRSQFDQLKREEIHAYCQEECLYLAKLARQLIDAHETAGLSLKHYYGAGSTASAFLDKIDVREYRKEAPDRMREPLASAFFGGRFENSVVGTVVGPVYNYDISSAYPYQAAALPCLLCGRWKHISGDAFQASVNLEAHNKQPLRQASSLALVRWTISKIIDDSHAWGPLPVRASNGTIAFPIAGRGGWTWKAEFLAAQALNPHVEALEAWVYDTDCDHFPFADIPTYYRERCRLGKDASGIVLKLGLNSVYGKLAQSKGFNPKYQSWIWSGNITSGCRAQLLTLVASAENPWDILSLATDGVQSRVPLKVPVPRDTGTFDVMNKGKLAPLGGWEEKVYEKGVFYARPGIYFPINPTEKEMETVRARGLGRRVVYERWKDIVDAWDERKMEIEVGGITRFIGAKSGVTWSPKQGFKRSANYGKWVDWPIKLTFQPLPKRAAIMVDNRLSTHLYFDWQSVPYSRALLSSEALMLRLAELIAEEQPNADFEQEDPE